MNRMPTVRVRDGSVLLIILVFAFVVSMAVLTVFVVSRQSSGSVNAISDQMRAKVIAEAGANAAYSVLTTNFGARTNEAAFPVTSFGGGVYDVSVQSIGTDQAVICSTGRYGNAVARTVLDIKNHPKNLSGSTNGTAQGAFGYAVVSGDQMTWTGTGIMRIEGKVHANGGFKMTGSDVMTGTTCRVSSSVEIWSVGDTMIYGDASAPVWKGKSPSNIVGTVTTGPVPLVQIPDIDLTPYYNHALANGQVYNGNWHFTGVSDLAPTGGIMWVNGNLKWSGSGRLVGCFIATGDVNLSGSGDHVKVAAYPAVVSRDGNINISGSGKFNGLLYARIGSFDKSGSGDVRGSIICGGSFSKSGSWQLLTYEDSTPVPPGVPVSTNFDRIKVEAWQE